jgi:hypothetical protein
MICRMMAFLLLPRKRCSLRFCLLHLKNSSISHDRASGGRDNELQGIAAALNERGVPTPWVAGVGFQCRSAGS